MTQVTNALPNCQVCLGSGQVRHQGVGAEADAATWANCAECDGTGKWQPFAECPCLQRCGIRAAKLSVRTGHAFGCKCRSCLGRRNRSKGRKAQSRMHYRLDGEGPSPANEETARGYLVTVFVMPEAKKGQQIPRGLIKALATDWFRRALRQSERAIPVGSNAKAAIYFEPDGSETGWLLVRIPR